MKKSKWKPGWLPWGTPELTLNLLENDEPIWTIWNLFIKHEDIHERICELNSNLLSFWISTEWLTLSKALAKSV